MNWNFVEQGGKKMRKAFRKIASKIVEDLWDMIASYEKLFKVNRVILKE